MKPNLLQYLVCPECKQPMYCDSKELREIITGTLKCKQGHSYEITNGIPRFVKDMPKDVKQTQESFGKKWHRANNYGFDKITKDFHLKWFLKRFGFSNQRDLVMYLKARGIILDAGCGTGRLSNTLAELTNNLIIAVDISNSVDVAKENLKAHNNVCVIQADLNKLPFGDDLFDLIICDMVIHHTPDPEQAFYNLVNHMKETGEFFTYVYRVKGPVREYCDTKLREITTKMSFEECYRFAEIITKFGRDMTYFNEDLQRFFYWNIFKCFWNEEHGWDNSVITNFDWFHPRYAYRFNVNEVKSWIKKAGLRERRLYLGNSGISVVVDGKNSPI